MTHIIDGNTINEASPLAVAPGNMEASLETILASILAMQADLAAANANLATILAAMPAAPALVWAQYEDDEDTGGIVSVDAVHHQIHAGHMFTAEYSASVNDTQYLSLLFTVGALETHMAFGIAAGGQCSVTLYEAPPNVTGGTPITAYNMNRNSANVSGVAVAHTPTITDAGTTRIINGRLLPGGATQVTRVGNTARSGTEFDVKPSTKYLLRVQNTSGAAVIINVVAEYYHP